MNLLFISLAPAVIIMMYIYLRDKYEREPVPLVLKGLFLGALIIFPVGAVENYISQFGSLMPPMQKAAFTGFCVAGATEEFFKFSMVVILIWRNRNFNEKYDGIVYAASVALGFAAVENIFYVFSNQSAQVGWTRAFTAVPAHAIFGVIMGYYLGLAKFSLNRRGLYFLLALLMPVMLHGFYDFLLLSQHPVLLVIFVPFLFIMYCTGLGRMRDLNNDSVFNPRRFHYIDHPTPGNPESGQS